MRVWRAASGTLLTAFAQATACHPAKSIAIAVIELPSAARFGADSRSCPAVPQDVDQRHDGLDRSIPVAAATPRRNGALEAARAGRLVSGLAIKEYPVVIAHQRAVDAIAAHDHPNAHRKDSIERGPWRGEQRCGRPRSWCARANPCVECAVPVAFDPVLELDVDDVRRDRHGRIAVCEILTAQRLRYHVKAKRRGEPGGSEVEEH